MMTSRALALCPLRCHSLPITPPPPPHVSSLTLVLDLSLKRGTKVPNRSVGSSGRTVCGGHEGGEQRAAPANPAVARWSRAERRTQAGHALSRPLARAFSLQLSGRPTEIRPPDDAWFRATSDACRSAARTAADSPPTLMPVLMVMPTPTPMPARRSRRAPRPLAQRNDLECRRVRRFTPGESTDVHTRGEAATRLRPLARRAGPDGPSGTLASRSHYPATSLSLPDLDGRPRSAGGHRGMLPRWLCFFRLPRDAALTDPAALTGRADRPR
jgi:hypothetical protein